MEYSLGLLILGLLLPDIQIRKKLNIQEGFNDVWVKGKLQDMIVENFDDVWV